MIPLDGESVTWGRSTTSTILKTWGSFPFPNTTTIPPSLTTASVTEILSTTLDTVAAVQVEEKSCEGLANSGKTSRVYMLGSVRDTNAAGRDFYTRNCDLETTGGGWTIIQQRGGDWGGIENFTRSWDEYSLGFGNLSGEFWFGNEYIHR